MALKTTAHHKPQRGHQEGPNVCPPGDRGTDQPAVKVQIPIDAQGTPTGERGCDDKK